MATTATEMVKLLKQALASNVGVAEVVVDGQKVRYDRQQAMDELAFWERKAATESGTRSRFRGFNLNSGW